MRDAGVTVDRNSRLSHINDLVLEHEKLKKVKPDLTEPLLNELTDLVESPLLVTGSFDESFLDLPPEVLTRENSHYFKKDLEQRGLSW